MSLVVDQALPQRELAHSSQEERVQDEEKVEEQKTSYRDSLPDAPRPVYTEETYDDAMFDDYYDEMMEQAPRKKQETEQAPAVPALPAKSALRASRLLDGFGLKLSPKQPASLTQTTPQDLYLSSEEDASSSADEFSDYDFESDSEESLKSPTSRRSHEDTARVVSVVFAGKPSIIDLSLIRRSISPNSLQERRQSCLVTSVTEPALLRRTSTSSASTGSFSSPALPPRSSSMLSSILGKQRPQFLSIDPFAGKTYEESVEEEHRGEMDTPRTPKTPTTMFRRTLSLVRKRSRPMLNNTANMSRDTLTSPSVLTLPVEQPEETKEAEQKPSEPSGPITYSDIIRSAKKKAQSGPGTAMSPIPQSPLSPTSRGSRILSGFSMNRRRSVKAG